MKNSYFYTLLLSLLPGVGPSRYWSWIDIHQTPKNVLLAPFDKLPKISPAAKKALSEFQKFGEKSALAIAAIQILDCLEQQNAHLITHQHINYPGLLGQIERSPPLLFAKGNIALLSLPQIAIIGTRNPTASGIENTRAFARYLAQGGFTITSGLALGVDGIAHKATLDADGNTIAIMATGIDRVYPSRHQRLADTILDKGGLLVTEFAPGMAPHATHFPQRNRIISGLSLGVLVMEAAVKSGSLITARYALEQNREVFAVPSSIHNPQAKGCHRLIKQGAQLVETGEDIIQQLTGLIDYFTKKQSNTDKHTSVASKTSLTSPFSRLEQKILKYIAYDTLPVEQIIERSGLASSEVATALFNLELNGVVKHSNWGYEVIKQ